MTVWGVWVGLVSCAQNAELTFEPVPAWEPSSAVERDCASMCKETIATGCEMSPSLKRCSESCAESVALTGDCQAVTRAYVRCLGAEGLETCFDVPPGCDDAWLTWSMCSATGNGCGPVRCGAPDDGCACQAYCAGAIIQEKCVASGERFDCTCSVDDNVVSTCGGQLTSCAFFVGCCAEVVDAMQP